MLNVTRLLCGTASPGDSVRYGEAARHPGTYPSPGGAHHRPVVIWNTTRRCNLKCIHCYTTSTVHSAKDELTTLEAMAVVEDLAEFRVPVILFSGGEPLIRGDIYDLMAKAANLGTQPALSSDGTLLNERALDKLMEAGVNRAGISLDGLRRTNGHFRGIQGAFNDALKGIRLCREAGSRVSPRLTMTRANFFQLDEIFALAEEEGVQRLCIYHLAYTGRGKGLSPVDLDDDQRRKAVDRIFENTVEIYDRGKSLEVLTVDNHTDAPYLLLWAMRNAPERVDEIRTLLARNKGNSSGKGIICINEHGNVIPDQFWGNRPLGNVRDRPFSEIWTDENIPLIRQLGNRHPLLPTMCTGCDYLSLCNGNSRARAEAATCNVWGEDPVYYRTDEERSGIFDTSGV